MKNDCMNVKIKQLLSDESVSCIEVLIKCKTQDGMIYTMDRHSFEKKECPVNFGDYVCKRIFEILDGCRTYILDENDQMWISTDDFVSIKTKEIVRVWADVGSVWVPPVNAN